MFDGGESLPLAGEEKTTLSEDPEPYLDLSAGEVIPLEKPNVCPIGRIKHSAKTNRSV